MKQKRLECLKEQLKFFKENMAGIHKLGISRKMDCEFSFYKKYMLWLEEEIKREKKNGK